MGHGAKDGLQTLTNFIGISVHCVSIHFVFWWFCRRTASQSSLISAIQELQHFWHYIGGRCWLLGCSPLSAFYRDRFVLKLRKRRQFLCWPSIELYMGFCQCQANWVVCLSHNFEDVSCPRGERQVLSFRGGLTSWSAVNCGDLNWILLFPV